LETIIYNPEIILPIVCVEAKPIAVPNRADNPIKDPENDSNWFKKATPNIRIITILEIV
jgi:hypothetical protein